MLYLISFFAGVLTILAPCALPMIPVICGRGIDSNSRKKVSIILGSFVVSIVAFTLLLKSAVSCISIANEALRQISAFILIGFGIVMIFPHIRDIIAVKTKLSQS